MSSRLRTSANLGVELIAWRYQGPRAHAARRISTSSWRLPQSNIISTDGQARDFSHQNRDIKEQETGVDLAPKLPQIVSTNNYARGGQRQGQLYPTALNQPRRTTLALRFGRGSISMEATDDGTAATLHSQGHNRARRCPGNTEELSTLWRTSDDGEKDNLFSVFDSNDGALYASSNPMATTLLYNLHGNRLLRAWRQPSTVRLSIVRRRIWGLGMLLRSSDELDDIREADDAGGRTADERLHQTLLPSPQ